MNRLLFLISPDQGEALNQFFMVRMRLGVMIENHLS